MMATDDGGLRYVVLGWNGQCLWGALRRRLERRRRRERMRRSYGKEYYSWLIHGIRTQGGE